LASGLTVRERKVRLLRKIRAVEVDLRSYQKKLEPHKDRVEQRLITSAFLGLAEVFESYLEEDVFVGWAPQKQGRERLQ
jgi:hypothetical protein